MQKKVQSLIILGVGAHSRAIADLVEDMNIRKTYNYKILGFLDDNKNIWDNEIDGYPVLGPVKEARNFPEASFVNGIYSMKNLAQLSDIIERTEVTPECFPTFIHPLAYVSSRSKLGNGIFVYPGAFIYCEAEIEDFVLFKPHSTAGVKVKIGWGSVIGTNAVTAGGVKVGKSTYLGQGSTVREHLQISDRSVIGMGAVVLNNVAEGDIVAGNPARVIGNVD